MCRISHAFSLMAFHCPSFMLMRLCQSRVLAMDPSRGGRRVCQMTRETTSPRKTTAPMTAPITAPRGILLLAELADDVDDAAEAEADSRIGVDEEEIGMGGGFETGGIASEA